MKKILKKIKVKKSIFSKLVLSYVVFSVLFLFSFIACMIVTAAFLSSGDDSNMPPNAFVDEEGNIITMDQIKRLGGWVEELDEDFQVINVYGEPQKEKQSYTMEELSSLMNVSETEKNPYIGVLQYIEKRHTYILCIYERELVQIRLTLILGNQTTGGDVTYRLVMAALVILFACNCMIISCYLSKKIKKPLSEIVKGMEQVKAGERGVNLNFEAESEFVEIRDTFNMMIEELEESRREKEEMERKKSQLLLELSHDIKTPLATIKGYANAMESNLVSEEKKASYYQTIDKKADRVWNLAEDIK